ncbi:hypothetical protein C8Q80DRAFT_1125035 [Daedaleopsis nitida]|nr:hypothetical protein C8Q80DRAFT_1125035 [Daedaleopsis nitida]
MSLMHLQWLNLPSSSRESVAREEQLTFARKIREAILQSGLLSGMPGRKGNAPCDLDLNSFLVNEDVLTLANAPFDPCTVPSAPTSCHQHPCSSHEAMPEHLREANPLRDTNKPPAECHKRGHELFATIYRDSTENVHSLLDTAYPDLGWFCTTVGTDVLAPVELIYTAWHLTNARRGGAVRRCAMDVARKTGVVWRTGVPELEE